MSEQKINICMITDNNYVIPTAVAMTSAIINKEPEVFYNFFLIVNNISDFHKNKLKELENDVVKINFVEADVSKYQALNVHSHVPISAALKFDLPNILDLDKVLYMDGDIIARKCISEFYNLDIEKYYVAAIRDMGGEITQKFNQTIGIDKYFNSGILLLNLKKIRKNNLTPEFIKIKQEHPTWKCMDQDTLNYVMSTNTLWADVKYNCMIPLYRHMNYSLDFINEFYDTNYQSELEMEDDAVIIHFAGESRTRPWKVLNGSYGDLWDYYYRLSPYRNISLNRAVCLSNNYLPKTTEIMESKRTKRTKKYKLFGFIPVMTIKEK